MSGLSLNATLIGQIASIAIIPYGYIIYPKWRLQDLRLSTWLCVLGSLPLINLLLFLYLVFEKGNQGINDYGKPPRDNQWYH